MIAVRVFEVAAQQKGLSPGRPNRLLCTFAISQVLLFFGDVNPKASAEISRRPNFLVIFCDDLGYGDLGCFGHPTIHTPNIDRLASQGQRWTNFYVGASVCTPSRAALLTGKLPIRNGMMWTERRVLFPDSTEGLSPVEVTIAELLRQKGYATAAFGKWHLGHLPEFLPTEQGFDEFWGVPYSNDMDAQDGFSDYEAMSLRDANYVAPIAQFQVPILRNKEIVERPADQHTLTKRCTDKTIEFIQNHRDKPFFVYLAHNMPHIPLYASKNYIGKSRRGLYGDAVEEIDSGVGRIVATLEELHLSENTLIVFTSDNGPWLTMNLHGGSAGLLCGGKGTTYEGGMRVPAIFWWPGHLPPCQQMEMGATMDLLPTICSFAGVEVPQNQSLDGYDLTSVLQGETNKSPRDRMFYWREKKLFAVRVGPWKAHFITEDCYGNRDERIERNPPLLYQLDNDPGEKYNLAPFHPEVIARLQTVAEEHLKNIDESKQRASVPATP